MRLTVRVYRGKLWCMDVGGCVMGVVDGNELIVVIIMVL